MGDVVRSVLMKQREGDSSSGSGDGARGRIVHQYLSNELVTILHNTGFHPAHGRIPVFPRYRLGNMTFHSWDGRRLRNSSVCKFKHSNGEVAFGSIRCFCFCGGTPVAIIGVFGPGRGILETVRSPRITELTLYQ